MVVREFGCDFTDTSSGQAKMSKLFWYQDQIL